MFYSICKTSSIKYDTQDIKLWSMADINYAQSQIGHCVLYSLGQKYPGSLNLRFWSISPICLMRTEIK